LRLRAPAFVLVVALRLPRARLGRRYSPSTERVRSNLRDGAAYAFAVERTNDELAVLVKQAFGAGDASAFAELLDPDVTWGAPGARNPTCKNRNQVLNWYQRAQESGVHGSAFDVEVVGDRLLVSLSVRGTEGARERGGTALRFQVLTVRDGRITDIVGFDDKAEALSHAQ
jgi:ketosteroid isomerase-like protein